MLDLSPLPSAPSAALLGVSSSARWAKLRDRRAAPPAPLDLLAPDCAALLALANGMAQWHRSMRFCAKCGGLLVMGDFSRVFYILVGDLDGDLDDVMVMAPKFGVSNHAQKGGQSFSVIA